MSKIRLALIAGGTSGEREVSLRGAAGVEQALNKDKYEVLRYDPATDLARLAADAKQVDVAFILLHGIHGEDGTIQGMLELLGIPYQGSGVLGSALAMDKNLAKTMYRLHGLPVASWEMASKEHIANPAPLLAKLNLPVVVKPIRQGSSLGMSVVREAEQLSPALETAFEHDSQVMVEEFIKGREITVGVLGNDELMPLPLVEVIPDAKYDFFDYEAKYQPGATREVCPAEVDDSIREKAQEYGLKAHQALQLRGYSRTDMIVRDDEIFLLETNTIPGMTPTSLLPQAAAQAGLDFPTLLDRLIALAME
ncbi:MAG: D-alanine--D-alanine ligase [Candidatus Electrothrix aestuarii]|uniref:D-alanine--D-alanine ligase n=1 Tax=Candidatus Electrothrix aestuarii TaxID=3062594 RepID=A0AAU8M177_9BACT|nr:D-alanine--D-alanine ligase [Candidatus Electrothrix aestuarii]